MCLFLYIYTYIELYIMLIYHKTKKKELYIMLNKVNFSIHYSIWFTIHYFSKMIHDLTTMVICFVCCLFCVWSYWRDANLKVWNTKQWEKPNWLLVFMKWITTQCRHGCGCIKTYKFLEYNLCNVGIIIYKAVKRYVWSHANNRYLIWIGVRYSLHVSDVSVSRCIRALCIFSMLLQLCVPHRPYIFAMLVMVKLIHSKKYYQIILTISNPFSFLLNHLSGSEGLCFRVSLISVGVCVVFLFFKA